MSYGRIIQKKRVKYYEVADNVFAAISPYKGISWVNAGFINKGKGLVYDTFFELNYAGEMLETYREVSGRNMPGFVVNSHYNSDHTYGNKVFEESCIIMHKNAQAESKSEPLPWIKSLTSRAKDDPSMSPGERFLANEFDGFDLTGVEWVLPDIEVAHDFEMRLGDTEVNILNVAPAHSNSDLLLWMPKEKVLFAGDIVFNGCSAYSEAGVMNWVKVLDRIMYEIKPEIIVPGHGGICGLEFVQEQKDYLINLIEEFNKHYDEEIDSLELTKKIDVSRFLHWVQPERVYASIDVLVKGKRGQSPAPNWNEIPAKLSDMRTFMEEKYGKERLTWDPFSPWAK